MANAITARIQGDDYQARWFWINACRLFEERAKVVRVEFEANGVQAFDDVAVHYEGMFDTIGNSISCDFYQVKFHVTAAGSCKWNDLMSPDWINAQSVSILQRLRNAQQKHAPNGTESRFHLYTPWNIHSDDHLAKIYGLDDGSLLLDKLFDGKKKSHMATVRNTWREHVGVGTDEELRMILRPLRIERGPTAGELQKKLNDKLQIAGLLGVEEGRLVNPYDELYRKLLGSGKTSFTRDDIEEICKREKLWKGNQFVEPKAYRIGIRSFSRWAESLEDETDEMIDLTQYFPNRLVKSGDQWQAEIYPEICSFLAKTVGQGKPYHLHLHAHSSIAFAAGYCIETKAPFNVVPVQTTAGRRDVWRPESPLRWSDDPDWETPRRFVIDNNGQGCEVAVVLNVARSAVGDVQQYVATSLPQVQRILSFQLPGGPGHDAVHNATHAKLLAQSLSNTIKNERTADERGRRLHLFVAAPNAFVFFLGQMAKDFAPCAYYEFLFGLPAPESMISGSYQPSFSFS